MPRDQRGRLARRRWREATAQSLCAWICCRACRAKDGENCNRTTCSKPREDCQESRGACLWRIVPDTDGVDFVHAMCGALPILPLSFRNERSRQLINQFEEIDELTRRLDKVSRNRDRVSRDQNKSRANLDKAAGRKNTTATQLYRAAWHENTSRVTATRSHAIETGPQVIFTRPRLVVAARF